MRIGPAYDDTRVFFHMYGAYRCIKTWFVGDDFKKFPNTFYIGVVTCRVSDCTPATWNAFKMLTPECSIVPSDRQNVASVPQDSRDPNRLAPPNVGSRTLYVETRTRALSGGRRIKGLASETTSRQDRDANERGRVAAQTRDGVRFSYS